MMKFLMKSLLLVLLTILSVFISCLSSSKNVQPHVVVVVVFVRPVVVEPPLQPRQSVFLNQDGEERNSRGDNCRRKELNMKVVRNDF